METSSCMSSTACQASPSHVLLQWATRPCICIQTGRDCTPWMLATQPLMRAFVAPLGSIPFLFLAAAV